MKIFNRENDQLVVYLQRKNIKAIIKYEDKAPKVIYKTAKQLGLSDFDETHDEEFVRLTDKKTIDFLKRMHWIPDYRELRDLSDEDLEAKTNERSAKIKEMQNYFMALGPYNQRSNPGIPQEISKINQTVKDINAYLWTRQGKYDTPIELPLMIDCMEDVLESSGTIRIGLSIDKKHILVENKSGARATSVNPFEMQMGIMAFATELNLNQNAPGELAITVRPDSNNRFLVADYNFEVAKDYVPPVQEEPQEPTRLVTPQKKKSLFQRVFSQKQKDEN